MVEGSAVDLVVSLGPHIQPPTASISADPMEISPGGTSTLTWTTSNADTVTIAPVIGEVGPAGSIPVILESTVTFTITATNEAGTVSDSVTIVVNASAAISVYITLPLNDEIVSKPYIMVEGYITNPNGEEIGVTVNGVLAFVDGDRFVANNIPLIGGENTITATVTDINGNCASNTVIVRRNLEDYLRITTSTQSGISPLETILEVSASFDIASLSLSYTGPAALDFFESLGDNKFKASMSNTGIYYFFVDATDTENKSFSDTVAVHVIDRAELDSFLKAKWDGMKTLLVGSDIQGALKYFHESSKDEYEEIFTALSDKISSIASSMRDIELIYSEDRTAKYRIKRQEEIQGQIYDITYYIYFVQDLNGLWRIEKF